MTESSKFWNGTTVGDAASEAPYDAPTEFALALAAIAGSMGDADKGGVWNDDLSELAATNPASTTVRIASGRALVYGNWYENTANVDTTPAAPAASTRIDRYVLRKDWVAQTVRITRIAGVEGGGAPALVQSAGVTWDYPICQASTTTGGVVTLTDQRTFIPNHTRLGSIGTNTHAQIDTFMAAIDEGAWTDFTPTLTQGVGVTITVTHARYAIVGKIAHVELKVSATSSGTLGARIGLTAIPAAIAPKYTDALATAGMGTAVIYPGGASNVRLVAVTTFSATELSFMADNILGAWYGTNPSVQIVSGGVVSMNLMYELA